jgi:spore maturation protein CgeB
MFDVLFKSRITLNSHVDVAGGYAGNLRLFEATGSGALLITDWKKNLHEMFDARTEVLAYRTACLEIGKYYLSHDNERQAIREPADAGRCANTRSTTESRNRWPYRKASLIN